MLSIHQDFVDPDPALRKKDVEHTMHCIAARERAGHPRHPPELGTLEHDQVLSTTS